MEKMRHDAILQLTVKSQINSIPRKPLAPGARDSIANARDSQRISLLRESTHSAASTGDPAIRFALDQITTDKNLHEPRGFTTAPTANSAPSRVPNNHSRNISNVSAFSDGPAPQLSIATAVHMIPAIATSPATTAPTLPWRDPRHSLNTMNRLQNQPDIFLPYDHNTPQLRFLPAILRPLLMGTYLTLCLLMIAALLFSGIWSGIYAGLCDYTQFGGTRYFVFQYLPGICGMFLLLWLFQIQIALQRVAPFIAMASTSSKSRTEGPHLEMQTTNFILPKTFYFRAGQPIIGVCMVVFWLQIFTVPLLACLYNVYFYGDAGTGHWRWMTVQGIVWTLFALYLLLALAIILLSVWLFHRRTGLRWDPRSLADVVVLLDRSNIISDYAGSEIFATKQEFRSHLRDRSDRIGFWHTTRQPTEVFYGIGEEGAATRQYSLRQGRIQEKTHASHAPSTRALSFVLTSEHEYQHTRRVYLPWYLRLLSVLVWCALAIGLYTAFLVISFINRAVLRGFSPLTHVAPDAEGFSATNFLYSFIPALIAQMLFLCWLSVDYAFRRLQPYASMSSYRGSSADKTILLDYTARLPVSVTLSALMDGDLRVAWFSLLSLITAAVPVLAGGCFWAQFYIPRQEVRVAVDPSAYYVLCAFLALYAFSLPLILPGLRHRRLPHANTTLAEQISWLYQSQLLGERTFGAPTFQSRGEMVARLVTSNAREMCGPHGNSETAGNFSFGRFVGRDQQYHLGIERLQPGDSRHMREPYEVKEGMRDSGIETGSEPSPARTRATAPHPSR